MKKRSFVLVITLVLIIGIGGCGEKEVPEGSNTLDPASVGADAFVSPEPTTPESELPSSPLSAEQNEAKSGKVYICLF